MVVCRRTFSPGWSKVTTATPPSSMVSVTAAPLSLDAAAAAAALLLLARAACAKRRDAAAVTLFRGWESILTCEFCVQSEFAVQELHCCGASPVSGSIDIDTGVRGPLAAGD